MSAAPQDRIETYRNRMRWSVPWYTLVGDDFSRDFDVEEYFGINVFIRNDDEVFRTYFVNARGVETIGSALTFLDLTPLGRQEAWRLPRGSPARRPVRLVATTRRVRPLQLRAPGWTVSALLRQPSRRAFAWSAVRGPDREFDVDG